jgi:predicted phosphoribosyltransferase
MGAIAAVGDALETVRNEPVIDRAGIDEAAFEEVRACELTELRRRTAGYRQGREAPSPAGRHVIVVDDGLATGSTMRAAVAAARRPGPAWLVVAVPVASRRVCRELAAEVDEVVCPWTPATYSSVAQGYADFRQVTDDEVRAALAGAGSGTTG